jgi:hypothetical protein
MKKYVLPLALISMVTLQACSEKAVETDVVVADAPAALETSSQRLSYGIAFGLGSRMAADAVPMDMDAFIAGMSDGMTGA